MDEHKKKNTPMCKWCILARDRALNAPAKPAEPKPEPKPKPKRQSTRRLTDREKAERYRQRLDRENARRREERAKNPKSRPVAKCGTPGGYDRHRRQGTPYCDPCRKAASKASGDRARERRRREREGLDPRKPGRQPEHYKVSAEQVLEIVARVRAGEKQAAVGADYGMPQVSVSKIMNGDRWSKVTGIIPKSKRKAQEEQEAA
jgi:hypothetical protein